MKTLEAAAERLHLARETLRTAEELATFAYTPQGVSSDSDRFRLLANLVRQALEALE